MICKHLLIFICDFYLITKQNNIHFTNSLYSYFPIPFGKQNEKWKAKCKRKIGHWVNEDAVLCLSPLLVYVCVYLLLSRGGAPLLLAPQRSNRTGSSSLFTRAGHMRQLSPQSDTVWSKNKNCCLSYNC